jgi:hypothetical protein
MDTPFAAPCYARRHAGSGHGAVHHAGVNDAYNGLTRLVPETLRELRGLFHLLYVSHGVSAEILCDHCNESKVACIETRLTAVGP